MLPATLERSQKKLALLTSLGPALLATRGFASKEVESTYSAAQARFQRLRGELTLAKGGLSAASEVEHDFQPRESHPTHTAASSTSVSTRSRSPG